MARLVVDEQELTELIVPVQDELSLQMDWVEAGLDAAQLPATTVQPSSSPNSA